MSIEPGGAIGPYSIDREIGRGGMGVVYLGHDTRLDRPVAIKSLPEHLAQDPDRLTRFEREAKTLASLNHPNVAGIHGIEEHDGAKYLILEYVEGETLAERLDRGSLPVDEACELASQIIAGVEAAHEAGVIHRDLKPDNIKITPDDQIKVLDFGLAKSTEAQSTSSTNIPTVTSPAVLNSPTIPGAIMGTAPYMSPEQARGRTVDKRTDIWSFGVILYEMLTNASPFRGETVSDSIGAILHKDVDLKLLPADTPRAVRRVLRRCLERDKSKRLRDIGDAGLELLAVPQHEFEDSKGSAQSRIPIAAALFIGILLGSAAIWFVFGAATNNANETGNTQPRRYTITLPDTAPIAPPSAYPFGLGRRFFSLSPDGATMIYTALVDDRLHLYTRNMETGAVSPVPGGQDGYSPVYAPDGRSIVFAIQERLFTLNLGRGHNPEPITGADLVNGLAWATDGALYYCPLERSAIYSMPSIGSDPLQITTQASIGESHFSPSLSPDEDLLLFSEFTGVLELNFFSLRDSSLLPASIQNASDGRMIANGAILFMRDGRLMATTLDPRDPDPRAGPKTVVSDVRTTFFNGQFDLSHDGALIYAEGVSDQTGRYVWIDKDGRREELNLGLKEFVAFELSPDNRFLATPIREGTNQDIWIYDLDRPQAPSRITFGGIFNAAIWSSDGRFLLYTQIKPDGSSALYAKKILTNEEPFVVHGSPSRTFPLGFDSGTNELLFSQFVPEHGFNIMRGFIDLDEDEDARLHEIEPIQATRHSEPFAAISPDRNWIVANSDETGRWELYISSYPEMNSRIQLSTTGGEEPRWTADGSRVIYRWNDDWFEVKVTTDPELRIDEPRVITSGAYINPSGYSWDMTDGGERLLLIEGPQQDTPVTELQVITNFDTELERLLRINDEAPS